MLTLLRAARPGLERLLPVVAVPLAAPAAVPGPAASRPTCQQRLYAQNSSSSTAEQSGSVDHNVSSGAAASAAASSSGSFAADAAPAHHTAEHRHSEDEAHLRSVKRAQEDAAFQQQQREQLEELRDAYDRRQQQSEEAEEEGRHNERTHDDAAFQQQRRELLAAALRHVPQLGWAGGAAAAAAAADLGLSPAAAGMLGSDAELVQAFFQDCNRRLEGELGAMQGQLAEMDTRERLRTGLVLRLNMLEPLLSRWPQGLALLAQPQAAPRTLALYAELADAIWHASGDAATDLSWYTKRALLVGVYSATELYMLTDCSPGFADTFDQLDRRLGDALALGRAAGDASSLAGAAAGAAGSVLAQLTGLLGGRHPGPPPL